MASAVICGNTTRKRGYPLQRREKKKNHLLYIFLTADLTLSSFTLHYLRPSSTEKSIPLIGLVHFSCAFISLHVFVYILLLFLHYLFVIVSIVWRLIHHFVHTSIEGYKSTSILKLCCSPHLFKWRLCFASMSIWYQSTGIFWVPTPFFSGSSPSAAIWNDSRFQNKGRFICQHLLVSTCFQIPAFGFWLVPKGDGAIRSVESRCVMSAHLSWSNMCKL